MNSANAATEAETRTRVLIVEDMPWDAEFMSQELVRGGLDCVTLRVETESEFRKALEKFRPDVILADHRLPRFSGKKALQIVQGLRLDTPVILVSGTVTEEVALQCLQAGVADYLLKDNLVRLGPAVKSALESARIRRANDFAQCRVEVLSTIVQDSLNEIYVFSADTLVFLDANRAALTNLGYARDEFYGLTPLDVKSELTRTEFESMLQPLLSGERDSVVFQTIHTRKDETEYPVEVHLQRLEYMGKPAFVAIVMDLEACRMVEDERTSLEMRLSAFADSTADAVIVSDADGRIRFWNRAATSIFGFSADEVLDEPLLTIVPERLRAQQKAGMKAAVSGGPLATSSPRRTAGLHKSGVEVPIELTLGSWDEGGERFFSVVARDITERVKAEEQLRASTEYYRAILEHLPVVTYEAALDGGTATLWLSPQIEDMLGTRRDAWVEDRNLFLERVHPDDRDRVAHAVSEGHRSGSMDIEYRISHEDGRFLCVRDRAVVGPSVSNDGSRVFRGVMVDVTAANQSERERALLSAAVEQSSNLVIITDTEGNIQYANPAFETITGYSREEVIGKNTRLLNSGRQPPAFYEEMWAELTAGRSWTREFVNRRKDGTEYHQRSTIFPIQDAEGRIQNLVAIEQDVSKERALEEQLRQAQKMEAVGQLTGGIAHDFNNVLAAILTNAQLLAMALPPELAEEASEVRDIERAARRGADLIKRLMAFSRDEHLDLEAVDPSEILEDTVDLLKRLLPESIELTLEEAHAGAFINVDRSGMQQILLNLATNARDAMPEGGTLAISTRVSGTGTGRSEMDGDPRVEIAVRDTGVGMDAKTLERAFEPFFTTKDRGKGTGLGLAMVHALVQRHGGTTEVVSEPGIGTTFTVSLPLAEPEERRTRKREAVRREPSAHSGMTLLLVEDEDALRRAGQRALERFGYRVLLAENGLQALELLEAHREEISLVVTDLIMPEKGGGELYAATSDWEPRPPFLITSGYSPYEVGGGILDGNVPFLRKPWDAVGLVEAVGEALDRSADKDGRSPARGRAS